MTDISRYFIRVSAKSLSVTKRFALPLVVIVFRTRRHSKKSKNLPGLGVAELFHRQRASQNDVLLMPFPFSFARNTTRFQCSWLAANDSPTSQPTYSAVKTDLVVFSWQRERLFPRASLVKRLLSDSPFGFISDFTFSLSLKTRRSKY